MKVSLEYYQTEYLNDYIHCSSVEAIPELAFDNYELKARRFLSSLTFRKLDRLKEFDNNIKNCICEMAEVIYKNDVLSQSKPKGISSESTDGHSVSYEQEDKKRIQSELYSVAQRWLGGTKLLYVGACVC